MASVEDALYRLQLAQGLLQEAQGSFAARLWRSCVDNSQLATENAAKAVLALVGPVGRTHSPDVPLGQAIAEGRFQVSALPAAQRLSELAQQLGWQVHSAAAYGDEMARRTPWELFDEPYARNAVAMAEEALALARQLVEEHLA